MGGQPAEHLADEVPDERQVAADELVALGAGGVFGTDRGAGHGNLFVAVSGFSCGPFRPGKIQPQSRWVHKWSL
ncbi:hypothetical protein GCM10010170_049720 [Dactylosporangium salmoneum]|uniref:Uncharacterized protein n=1 Tax=Dactylosporangium salmoneum TaxID=53361 RepID=A0ABN3GNN3_9ACTN